MQEWKQRAKMESWLSITMELEELDINRHGRYLTLIVAEAD